MATPTYKIQPDKIMNLSWIAFDGISEDDVDAFVLNLRLLIQDRDGFSIRCLSKIYEKDDVPKEISEEFSKHRQIWKTYRRLKSLIIRPESNEKLSNGELFDIIFYGGLAHQDENYINEFFKLTKQGAFSTFVFGFFLSSLNEILNVVRNIRDINNKVTSRSSG